MADTAIHVEHLSKLYHIGAAQKRHDTLRDAIVSAFNVRTFERSNVETLWALRDVSFEVQRGEVVGIIGRNGAGKSTLLKILSRITEPTEGRAIINGRVGSLLEVGTGFHPELTGRENIYLNGAILGMKRAEIDRKFDEIVAFAEIEKFLDTPVKRYSSGMYVRLAFAVAAHLEPEILLVDEVLAVGDAAFQKKCLGKMGDVAKEGRTVLFVSHNMVAIQSLCKRALWLNLGKVMEDGAAGQVVTSYLGASLHATELPEEVWDDIASAPGNDVVRLHRIRVQSQNGSGAEPLTMQTPFLIQVEYWNLVPDAYLHITLHLYTEQEVIAFTTGSGIWNDRPMPTGLYRATCYVPGNLLNSGRHRFAVLVVRDKARVIYRYESTVSFDILDLKDRQDGWMGKEPGVVQPILKWTTEYIDGISGTMVGLANSDR